MFQKSQNGAAGRTRPALTATPVVIVPASPRLPRLRLPRLRVMQASRNRGANDERNSSAFTLPRARRVFAVCNSPRTPETSSSGAASRKNSRRAARSKKNSFPRKLRGLASRIMRRVYRRRPRRRTPLKQAGNRRNRQVRLQSEGTPVRVRTNETVGSALGGSRYGHSRRFFGGGDLGWFVALFLREHCGRARPRFTNFPPRFTAANWLVLYPLAPEATVFCVFALCTP